MRRYRHSPLAVSLLALAALLLGTARTVLAGPGTGVGSTAANPFGYLEPGEHTITRPAWSTRDVWKNFENTFTWNPIMGAISCPYHDDGGANMGYVHVHDNVGGN